MASGLRAKLNALSPAPSKPSRVGSGGLFCAQERFPLQEEFFSMDRRGLARLGASEELDVRRCLFLDTETTGLSGGAGTVAFLVGVGYVQGRDLVVEQFLMRDYGDEPEMLLRLSQLFPRFDTAVTFNGKTFDIPLLQERFTMCRMREIWRELDQLDLLHPARRAWKLRLGSCRLCELEGRILGIYREGDLPGSEVPQRYFSYLSSGDFSLMEDVLRHNRQDIASLAALLLKLSQVYANPLLQRDGRDRFSLGKVLEKQGDEEAFALFRLSDGVQEGNYRLFLLLRRKGDWEGARQALEQMVLKGQMGAIPHIELSKIYEHRQRDLRRALFYAKIALALDDGRQGAQIRKRIDRIEQKMRRQNSKKDDLQ